MTLWIPGHIFGAVLEEATAKFPLETGGILLGYWASDTDDPVVTEFTGPGPGAEHSARGFVPDQVYQIQEVARLYEESNRELHYLGDWHTHPNGPARMSRLDKDCLREISVHAAAREANPIMMILAGEPPHWSPAAWRWGSPISDLQVEVWKERLT